MSVYNLKLDELPILHAAYIFASDSDSNEDSIHLATPDCRAISKSLKESKGKNLTQIIKEFKNKPLRTKESFDINDQVYELYVLHASSDDIAVFLVEGQTLFTDSLKLKEEKENSLLILPFLDAALTRFLERSQIYGSNAMPSSQKKSMHKQARSKRILQMKETFSLEEVFRDLDVDGNGNIDLEEWKHGLTTMMGDDSASSISDSDLELVFKAICSNGSNTIHWRQFYSFFDGKKLTSRRHRTLSSQLNLTTNFASTTKILGTLNEDEDESSNNNDNNVPSKLSLPLDDQKENNENEHIQKVKQAIRECLNLGEDQLTLSGTTPYGGTPSSDHMGHSSSISLSSTPSKESNVSYNNNLDVDHIDVSKSLLRIEHCEDILELMETQLYQVPDLSVMTKWENRYQSHKVRINNFRKILNGMLSQKIISMKDENTTLLKQLENIRDGGGHAAGSYDDNLADLANLHNQQLSNLVSPMAKGKKHMRQNSKRHNRSRSKRSGSFGASSDDDTSSVDSEVNLVYTKGTRLSSKESETLINRVKLLKKEVKKLTKDLKKNKEAHKLEIVKMKNIVDQQKTKIRSYEKARQSMVAKQQGVQEQLRKVRATKSTVAAVRSNNSQSASSQREISLLKKQLKNTRNDLEAEQERNRNLQKKIQRVITNNARDNASGSGGASTVSMNKLKRLEKEKDKLDQEVIAKTKKMDEMFLKLGKNQREYAIMEKRNAELEAKLGSFTTQMKEVNKRTMELQSITDDRDRCLKDIENLNAKMIKLNERIAKLKSRNKKMKDRIKNLLLTIEEYDKLATHSRKLIADLSALQRELNMVEQESAKYKNENDTLNARIAELKAKIKAKKTELDSTTVRLEKFKDDLSAEYSIINKLQEELEQKENALNELESQHQDKLNKNLSEKELLENKNEELNMELIRSKAQIEQSQKVINRYKEKAEKYEKQIEELNEKLINYEQDKLMKLNSRITDLQSKLADKNDEIALLKQKNEKLIADLNEAKDISDAIKEKNDEIDDLMNKIESLQTKLSNKQEEYKNKCNEYDELLSKFNKLQKDFETDKAKIGKLNIKIKELNSSRMQQDDETKLKLKQYNVQIITIEENKKLIEKLRNDVGEYKTKWQLEKEAFERYKNSTKSLQEEVDEKDKLIKKQKKKIKDLRNELDMSGYGDSKQKSTLSLLRKNVDEMESIIRTKDFEIKKLKNNMKSMGMGGGGGAANVDQKELNKKIADLEKNNEALTLKIDRHKATNKKQKESLIANKELLTIKNDEISKLKIEIGELKEVQLKMEEEEKENQKLQNKLAQNKNETNEQVEKLTDKVKELQNQLEKLEKEKQRKIDSLESELAEKDSVLLQISKTYGTEFQNSEDIDQ